MLDRACTIEGCARPITALGLCGAHYMRQRRHGSATGGRTPVGAPLAFIEKASVYQGDDCLLWPFGTFQNGYPAFWIIGEAMQTTATRTVCEKAHGPPPFEGAETAHSCNVRPCVNQKHIRWATHTENMADMTAHGTLIRGEQKPGAKLTEAQVREVRALQGVEPAKSIAARLGLHPDYVQLIWARKRWAWLE